MSGVWTPWGVQSHGPPALLHGPIALQQAHHGRAEERKTHALGMVHGVRSPGVLTTLMHIQSVKKGTSTYKQGSTGCHPDQCASAATASVAKVGC